MGQAYIAKYGYDEGILHPLTPAEADGAAIRRGQ